MDTATELAKETGVGATAVANSTHFGAAAYFAMRAARAGAIGMAFCNADALVKVHNGRESFFGTNPICICAPMDGEDPFCLDMATSLAAWNKVKNARASGASIPEGWAFDELGHGVTDPDRARSLAPLGGYKGFDLGMVVDILCALLANGPMSKDIPPMFDAPLSTRRAISHFFLALDVSKFVPLTLFMSRLSNMAERVRSVPGIDAATGPVMVAGDPEKKMLEKRRIDGIPVEDEKFAEFLELMPAVEGSRIFR
jgi:LDH2 family malate/lactate/ureidoglycolate dehydrogenase